MHSPPFAQKPSRSGGRAWEVVLFCIALVLGIAAAIYYYEQSKPKEHARVDLLSGETEVPLELSSSAELRVWLDVRAGREIDEYELSDGLRDSLLSLRWIDSEGRETETSCDAGNGWSEQTSRKKRVKKPYIVGAKNECTLPVSHSGRLHLRVKWADGLPLQSAVARIMLKSRGSR